MIVSKASEPQISADMAYRRSPAPVRLAAGADWSVNALLDLGDARVAGYTVELFYP